jgi:sec-independent protein translocase protein TatA
MGSLGTSELIIILVILLVVFGGSKLPQLARSLGQAQSELKKGLRDGADDDSDAADSDAPSNDDGSAS